jgi:hypothetical protein
MRTILSIVLTVVPILISLALVIGVFVGLGWLLTLIFPFSLFEGTVVGMLSAAITRAIWRNVLQGMPPVFEDDDADFYDDEIPPSRFREAQGGGSWENWFRYNLANSIYEDFLDAPYWSSSTGERQLQELAIRIGDAALAGLKKKPPQTRRLSVSRKMLQHELSSIGQQPYDDDILDSAVASVNVTLVHLGGDLRMVIQEDLWDEPAELFW